MVRPVDLPRSTVDHDGPAEFGRAEVSSGEFGPAEVGMVEVSPAEVGPAEVYSVEVFVAQQGALVICGYVRYPYFEAFWIASSKSCRRYLSAIFRARSR